MPNDNAKTPVQKKTDPSQPVANPSRALNPKQSNTENNNPVTQEKRSEIIKRTPSPIQSQHTDIRAQARSSPVTITFLDGDYAGQTLDLGLAVEEVSQDQSAEWTSNNGKGIRAGANFNGISARNFSIKLTFYDRKHDISHLVENLAHLHEIGPNSTTPPTLLWKQGGLRATRVVCLSFNPTYQHPIGGKEKGFRYAEVELKFQLLGGKASGDALAPPLSSTPLDRYRRTQTINERQKRAAQTQVDQLLAPCIEKEGHDELSDILKHNRQQDESAILALPSKAFVQAAVGGLFSKATLAKPSITQKLKEDLALVIAEREEGIQFESRKVAEALRSGDASGLSAKSQQIFDGLKSDQDLILGNILSQDIGESSKSGAFDRERHPTAFSRFQRALDCGLNLRNKGRLKDESGDGNRASTDDVKILQEINNFLADRNNTDSKIREVFGVKTPEEIKVLKNSIPYSSKEQFISDSSRATVGLTGYNLWSNFVTHKQNEETPKQN